MFEIQQKQTFAITLRQNYIDRQIMLEAYHPPTHTHATIVYLVCAAALLVSCVWCAELRAFLAVFRARSFMLAVVMCNIYVVTQDTWRIGLWRMIAIKAKVREITITINSSWNVPSTIMKRSPAGENHGIS